MLAKGGERRVRRQREARSAELREGNGGIDGGDRVEASGAICHEAHGIGAASAAGIGRPNLEQVLALGERSASDRHAPLALPNGAERSPRSVVNAPFRFYWAYNPLRVNELIQPPIAADRSYFPNQTTFINSLLVTAQPNYLREQMKTFRFTISRTF